MSNDKDAQPAAIPAERLKQATSRATTDDIAETDKKTTTDATDKITSPDSSVSSSVADEADGSRSGGVM